MKKFTLMMIAMLVSVVSMAGTPKKNFAPSNAVKSMLKPGFLQKKVDLGAERVSLKGKERQEDQGDSQRPGRGEDRYHYRYA